MKLISNTGPIIGLAKIGRLDLLNNLAGEVLIPIAFGEGEGISRLCQTTDRGVERIRVLAFRRYCDSSQETRGRVKKPAREKGNP